MVKLKAKGFYNLISVRKKSAIDNILDGLDTWRVKKERGEKPA